MLHPILQLIYSALDVYAFIVFIYIILHLLCLFKVLNPYQPVVGKLLHIFGAITEPVLSYIRRYVKPINNFDLSPIILFLAISFVQYSIIYYFG